ncbi:MAG: class II aldolase/adducin family protein [Pirellulales bacterium]
MSVPTWLPPRDEILATMERIYRFRMTTTSGGNVSIRDEQGDIWITPARVDKGNLRREDIVRVKADGTSEGLHRASSEFPFHQAIYTARPDLRAIVHAHPTALVAFSMTREVPDTRLFPQARMVCGEVGFAPYALPGSGRLGENIARTFQAGHDCVLLENHGVVVGGATLTAAFERFEALEFAAKTIVKARQLGPVRYLNEPQLERFRNRTLDLEPAQFPEAGTLEKESRRQLCEFIRRGVRQRLLISTEGSFSVKIDDDTFVISPSQRDRYLLEPSDFVSVAGGRRSMGKRPSRAALLHRAIYQKHPFAGAIVFAHPVNATAFSVTDAALDARTIPESYIFLRDVGRLEYGMQYGDGVRLAESVGPENPVAILENDGVLVVGTTVLDAFDRLEVLESTAEALINARHIGPLTTMSDEVLTELRLAFFGKA